MKTQLILKKNKDHVNLSLRKDYACKDEPGSGHSSLKAYEPKAKWQIRQGVAACLLWQSCWVISGGCCLDDSGKQGLKNLPDAYEPKD